VLGRNRILYSDGKTRVGWPSVVIDGPQGRDIFAQDDQKEEVLRRLVREKYRVKLLGAIQSQRCSGPSSRDSR